MKETLADIAWAINEHIGTEMIVSISGRTPNLVVL